MGRRRALSLIEVLLALAIIASLGVAIQSLMVGTVSGIGVDRLSEVKRHMVLDLLERFCHPYSDIEAVVAGGQPVAAGAPLTRVLTVDQAIAVVALPDRHAPVTRAVLTAGEVTGFTLVWTKGASVGKGNPEKALRLDTLWVFPVNARPTRGAQVSSFRIFAVRGT